MSHSGIVLFFLSVGILLFAYFYMYQRTRCDRFREDIFTIRDALFDHMWQEKLPYDLQAYRLMRQLLNGLIRAAPSLSFANIPLIMLLARRNTRHVEDLRAAIEHIPNPEEQEYFRRVWRNVRGRVLQYLFLEGPQWLVFRLFIAPWHESLPPKVPVMLVKLRSFGVIRAMPERMTPKFIELGKPGSAAARDLARVAPAWAVGSMVDLFGRDKALLHPRAGSD